MTFLLQIAFWILLLFAAYSYFLYPLILRFMPSRDRSTAAGAPATELPSMTVIIAARNEAARIRDKIENTLELPYGGTREIIVASDASTDGTDEIVADYAVQAVRLVRNAGHDGKETAQAQAVAAAQGEILVFTDTATSLQGDVLRRIAGHFADPEVGAVSSVDRFIDRDGRPAGEGAYVRYEMWLRRQESRVSSLVGLSGSFFAARADLCRANWSTEVPSDFMTAINCVRNGFVAVSADDVIGYYPDLVDPDKEFERKVRTVVRGMQALAATPDVLSFERYGLFAFQVWSHKILRWLVPWALAGLLPVSVLLAGQHPVYMLALLGQAALYALALAGRLAPDLMQYGLVRIPAYFVTANLAVLRAGFDFLRGRKVVAWTPSER